MRMVVQLVTLGVDGLDRLGDQTNFGTPSVHAKREGNGVALLIEAAAIERSLGVVRLDAGCPRHRYRSVRFVKPPNGLAAFIVALPCPNPHDLEHATDLVARQLVSSEGERHAPSEKRGAQRFAKALGRGVMSA